MKIKKDGKIIRLTESDLARIVKRVINEQAVGGGLDLLGNWDKNFPKMPIDGSSYDNKKGEGYVTLKSGEKIYFRCQSPFPRKEDFSTPYFAKGSPEYNNAYNVLKQYCKNPNA
jgi:hypothetical protein